MSTRATRSSTRAKRKKEDEPSLAEDQEEDYEEPKTKKAARSGRGKAKGAAGVGRGRKKKGAEETKEEAKPAEQEQETQAATESAAGFPASADKGATGEAAATGDIPKTESVTSGESQKTESVTSGEAQKSEGGISDVLPSATAGATTDSAAEMAREAAAPPSSQTQPETGIVTSTTTPMELGGAQEDKAKEETIQFQKDIEPQAQLMPPVTSDILTGATGEAGGAGASAQDTKTGTSVDVNQDQTTQATPSIQENIEDHKIETPITAAPQPSWDSHGVLEPPPEVPEVERNNLGGDAVVSGVNVTGSSDGQSNEFTHS